MDVYNVFFPQRMIYISLTFLYKTDTLNDNNKKGQ